MIRKSRHRRIKKQRRYKRLRAANTSPVMPVGCGAGYHGPGGWVRGRTLVCVCVCVCVCGGGGGGVIHNSPGIENWMSPYYDN